MKMRARQDEDAVAPSVGGWRFKLGIVIFVLAFAVWLLVPLAAAAGASAASIAALSGVLFVANKILLVLVIAVVGKSGLQRLKQLVLGYVTARTDEIGPFRHRVGVVLFCLPIFSSLLQPYVDVVWPGVRPDEWWFQLLGDVILIVSFFVLGANFWGKVRALFIRTARVVDLSGTP